MFPIASKIRYQQAPKAAPVIKRNLQLANELGPFPRQQITSHSQAIRPISMLTAMQSNSLKLADLVKDRIYRATRMNPSQISFQHRTRLRTGPPLSKLRSSRREAIKPRMAPPLAVHSGSGLAVKTLESSSWQAEASMHPFKSLV